MKSTQPNAKQKRWREEAIRLFRYEPETGRLVRRCRSGRCLPGEIAGTVERGYRRVSLLGAQRYAHRVIWLMVTGELPDQVDHINHNRDDNRWENLRAVDHHENHKNQKRSKANTSGTTGVWWHQKNSKWCAEIKVNHRKIHLGSFLEKSGAICARKKAEKKYGFHENHGAAA